MPPTGPMMTLDRRYDTAVLHGLAELVHAVRPDWDTRGIRSALVAAEARPKVVTLPEFTRAILAIALDPTSRTPARLAHEHPAWDHATVANVAPRRHTPSELCRTCTQPRGPADRPHAPDHDYEPWTEPAKSARAPRNLLERNNP